MRPTAAQFLRYELRQADGIHGHSLPSGKALEKPAQLRDSQVVIAARTELMGGKQLGFSDCELTTATKQTKRETFLSEMEVVVPWQALIDLIEPHYPKTSKK